MQLVMFLPRAYGLSTASLAVKEVLFRVALQVPSKCARSIRPTSNDR